MRHKYKKFLKAAYINYEEDYCSNAVLRSSRPPLSEILAPATFEVTLSPGEGYYWTTFYTSMANYQAPEGVIVYKEHLEGRSITPSTVDDRIINKGQGVVLRSSTSSITLTKTYSKSSDDYSDNSLIGTDYLITNPGHAYALSYRDSHGVAFYKLRSTGRIRANKAYLIVEDVYLTQWRMIGNSTVHTDEYLTQWKVSGNSQIQQYLTQWKVEGNSVVSNPSANLPQGYKKCKYLEFHGTEYIDSGVLLKNDIGFSLDLSTTTVSKTMIGARDNTLKGVLFGYHFPSTQGEDYRMYFAYGASSTNYAVQTNVCDGLLHHIVLDSQQAKIDNESVVIDRGNEFPQMPIFIGTWNNYSGTPDDRMFEGKMYSVRIYDSNGNLFNGIPCLDDNDVPCLYDTVSNTAFYNDGTGTFGYELEQPTILSCGDLGQDNKYHVKISDGVNVYDIALTEPLRKVGDVADSIELVNGVATVTRAFDSVILSNLSWFISEIYSSGKYRLSTASLANVIKRTSGYANILTPLYNVAIADDVYAGRTEGISVANSGGMFLYDENYNQADDLNAFKAHINGVELIYELATPTTEVIQAPQIAVSSAYTSSNDVAYSSFTYANPLIYSCGDYSDVDGKYHVKISNGVTIYDIPLTEPLRKVNDIVDTIEFVNGVATVTRNFASALMSDMRWYIVNISSTDKYRYYSPTLKDKMKVFLNNQYAVMLCPIYDVHLASPVYNGNEIGIAANMNGIYLYDDNYDSVDDLTAFLAHINGVELIYELATPTTETIEVSPFPVSPTDTYTSANDTSYSAFEYKKNVEIWSCGEYNATDGKYHILVQPQGGSIADIALDEPLRKVNNVADNIEFANGVTTVTRNIGSAVIGNTTVAKSNTNTANVFRWALKVGAKVFTTNIINTKYPLNNRTYHCEEGINADSGGDIQIFDSAYTSADGKQAFIAANADVEIIFELATPTTEVIQVSQIEEADSYSCVISQGGKAVEWSSFETE